MKGIFNFQIVVLLLLLMVVYLFACEFNLPIKNIGKRTESTAYVDSVKSLQLFDLYTYDQIYYHYVFDDQKFVDSITSNRVNGNVNRGDSLVIMISRMNPVQHKVLSLHGRNQYQVQYMGH